MQFPESWLREFCSPSISTEELASTLTMAGLEVEDSTPAAPPFTGIVVGEIKEAVLHPNADRLRVCTVDTGTGAALQIVCGAPNAAAGMKVPCALVGAALPGGLAIREAAVRGVVSHGMLCSARELGIDDDASGLLRLPDDAVVGADLRAQLRLDDTLITLKLTPNRADCLSLLGLARGGGDHRRVAGGAPRQRGRGHRQRTARRPHRGRRRLPALHQPDDRGHRPVGTDTGLDEGAPAA